MRLWSPTGRPMRTTDAHGSGFFRARRGGGRTHEGIDLVAAPESLVRPPFPCSGERIARPYGDGGPADLGVLLRGVGEWEAFQAKLFYVRPFTDVVGQAIKPGEPIGIALSLQRRYPGITDHVHLTLMKEGEVVDPTPYLLGDA